MTQMHGKHFFTGITHVKAAPRIHLAPVTEIEHPYRKCPKAIYLRLVRCPYCKAGPALVIGYWFRNTKSVDEHIMEAIEGHEIKEEGERT